MFRILSAIVALIACVVFSVYESDMTRLLHGIGLVLISILLQLYGMDREK
jgi:hypothetical protein